MPDNLKKEKNPIYMIIGTSATALILSLYAIQLSVPVISDETVTMGNAAWLEGYDWSLMVASLGGLYYRYAQALMTLPFFKWLDSPDTIYRCSMVLQALIQSMIVPVVYLICQRHLNIKNRVISVLLGMSVALIPSMALYTLYYRGDFLLGVLPWFALLFFLETVQAQKQERRHIQIMSTVLTAVCCALAYMAHTRGIVLCIAVVLAALLLRLTEKTKSLHWPVMILVMGILFYFDEKLGSNLKNALYSISGVNANAVETTDMGAYFNIFSYTMLKSIVMLCICWMYTLASTTQGLVLIGTAAAIFVTVNVWIRKKHTMSIEEKIVLLLSTLVFLGYYAIGALYFKGAYYELRTGALERRMDRVVYDRYAICGAGMIVFWALYVLCCKKKWISFWEKVIMAVSYFGVAGIFLWKAFPDILKYKGYIYNAIILNTFNKVQNAAEILAGGSYTKTSLIAILVLGFSLMILILLMSVCKKQSVSYLLLGIVLFSDLFFIQVNYVKIRKASNDYVAEATSDVVKFMRDFEADVTAEYPYVLKGGVSGVKIQFYQSQLMNFKLFGKKQEKELDTDNYFIISKAGDIDLTWYEDDYYLFKDFDYTSAEFDIVYVKGDKLMQQMESLGYEMSEYQKNNYIQKEISG